MEIAGLIIKCSFAVIIAVCALVFLQAFIHTIMQNKRKKKDYRLNVKDMVELMEFIKKLEEFANEEEKKEQKKKATTKKDTTKKKEEK